MINIYTFKNEKISKYFFLYINNIMEEFVRELVFNKKKTLIILRVKIFIRKNFDKSEDENINAWEYTKFNSRNHLKTCISAHLINVSIYHQ